MLWDQTRWVESLANRLARIILDHDPSAENEDVIAISMSYGYDIGIASGWQSRSFAFSPEQWRKRFSSLPRSTAVEPCGT